MCTALERYVQHLLYEFVHIPEPEKGIRRTQVVVFTCNVGM